MRFSSTLEKLKSAKMGQVHWEKIPLEFISPGEVILHEHLTVKNHIGEALWLGTWYHLTVKVYILNLVLNPIGILTSSLETNFWIEKNEFETCGYLKVCRHGLVRVQSSPVLRPGSASINSKVRRSHSCSYHYVPATGMISFTFTALTIIFVSEIKNLRGFLVDQTQ